MGKRQIGQLQPSELAVALVIADLASVPMSDVGIPLINGIIPIITLFILEELLSYISLKSEKARGIISGKPSLLIEKGVIIEEELRKSRYNLNELMEQLRLKNYLNVESIDYAILETTGQLSVIPKAEENAVTRKDMNIEPEPQVFPITLIIDGKINYENLQKADLTDNWLMDQLRANSVTSPSDVFLAYLGPKKKLHYQLKAKAKKKYNT